MFNMNTDNMAHISAPNSGEVNFDLIDKLFRSIKGGGGSLVSAYDQVSSKYNEIEKLRNSTSGENQPYILTKSREIAKNVKPIYSDERYESEI